MVYVVITVGVGANGSGVGTKNEQWEYKDKAAETTATTPAVVLRGDTTGTTQRRGPLSGRVEGAVA